MEINAGSPVVVGSQFSYLYLTVLSIYESFVRAHSACVKLEVSRFYLAYSSYISLFSQF